MSLSRLILLLGTTCSVVTGGTAQESLLQPKTTTDVAEEICGGFVNGFLHHGPLMGEEMKCISTRASTISKDMLAWIDQANTLMQNLLTLTLGPTGTDSTPYECMNVSRQEGQHCILGCCPLEHIGSLDKCQGLCSSFQNCTAVVYGNMDQCYLQSQVGLHNPTIKDPNNKTVLCTRKGAASHRRLQPRDFMRCAYLPMRERHVCMREIDREDQRVEQKKGQANSKAVAPGSSSGAEKGIDLGGVFNFLVASVKQIVLPSGANLQQCLQGNEEAFAILAQRISNVTFISGRLMASGADIFLELLSALNASDHQNFEMFGEHVGRGFRKVLLTNHSGIPLLPEGPPTQEMIQELMTGLADGFFGKGLWLGISSSERPLNEHINLEQCVRENVAFFETLWSAVWTLFSQQLLFSDDALEDSSVFGGVLVQLPVALMKCNLGPRDAEVLMDAAKSLASMHLELRTPDQAATHGFDITKILATGAADFEKRDWHKFAVDLGDLLRKLLVSNFARKYEIDANGVLRQQLLPASEREAATYIRRGVRAGVLVGALVMCFATLLGVFRVRKCFVSVPFQRGLGLNFSHMDTAGTLDTNDRGSAFAEEESPILTSMAPRGIP